MVVSFFLSMYYNVINAWGFWYLFHSFQVSSGQSRMREGRRFRARWGLVGDKDAGPKEPSPRGDRVGEATQLEPSGDVRTWILATM